MFFRTRRYSGYLRPISYIIDLAIISIMAYIFFEGRYALSNFIVYASVSWILLSVWSNFYEVYRFTHVVRIVSLLLKQAILFFILVFAYFGFYQYTQSEPYLIIKYVLTTFLFISVIKFTVHFLLKRYRSLFGGNNRKVIIIGKNKKTELLERFFNEQIQYGYFLKKVFDLRNENNIAIEDCIEYVMKNNIDEIYFSAAELNNEEISKLIDYADNNLKVLKFLPDNKEIYTKKLDFDYYGVIPILSLRKIPIDEPLNQFIKRGFDILLSLFVLIGILSWLTPILAVIIRMDSKGHTFFKQMRNGLDYKEFTCYK